MKCRDNKLHNDKYLKGNMENEFRYRQEQYFGKSQTEEQQLADSDRTTVRRNESDFYSVTGQRGGTHPVENGNNLSAGAVQPDFKDSGHGADERLSATDSENRTGVYENKLEELSDRAEESFGADSQRNQFDTDKDDGKFRTGWEDSRRMFEQYLAKRSGIGVGNSFTGEEVNSADNLKMDSNNRAVLGGINSLAQLLSQIIDDESEDEEERRKRIEAEQNGSDIGSAIGLAVGLVAGAISKEENIEYEDEKTGFNLNM